MCNGHLFITETCLQRTRIDNGNMYILAQYPLRNFSIADSENKVADLHCLLTRCGYLAIVLIMKQQRYFAV